MDKWLLLSFAVAQLFQVLALLRLGARNGDALDLLQTARMSFDLSDASVGRGSTVILTPPIQLSPVQAHQLTEHLKLETERTGVEFVVLPGPGWSSKVKDGAPE